MSTEIFLPEEAPKDRWGRYKIERPDGKTVGYTRVTTIAKTLSDTGSLADWKVRMAITGIVQRADLLAQASTAIDDRNRLNKIASDAIEAAGAYSRANLGTALHAVTQQIDMGQKPQILEGLRNDVETYRIATQAYGFEMLQDYIEVLLIHDDLEYAGTADRIVRTMTGKLVIFDLKTGASLDYAYGEIAVQLAAYANAQWVYDWKTGTRTPMPDIDKEVGIICHLPAGEGTCEFHEVNLTAGLEALHRSLEVRAWRKRKDLFKPYKFSDEKRRVVEPAASPKPQADLTARRTWLSDRIKALPADAQATLKLYWPQDTPRIADADNDALTRIVKVVEQIEAEIDQPFGALDPTLPKAKRRKTDTFEDAMNEAIDA